jgi:hypothetical protein
VLGVATIVLALLVPPLVRRARRRREGAAPDPAAARLRAALAALRSASPADPASFSDALAEALAAHLGVPAAAALSPDLEDRLVSSGLPRDLARRSADALLGLVDARYGGPPSPASSPARLEALARELERLHSSP